MENKLPDSETNCSACYEIAIDGVTKFKHTCGLEKTYKNWTPINCSKEKICLCDDIKGGHAIDCDYYQEALPSWEDKFWRVSRRWYFKGEISEDAESDILDFLRQTIKAERAEAVKELSNIIKQELEKINMSNCIDASYRAGELQTIATIDKFLIK